MNKNYSKNKISKRKPTRLREFDYSSNGAYFVTVCTKNKKCFLIYQMKIRLLIK